MQFVRSLRIALPAAAALLAACSSPPPAAVAHAPAPAALQPQIAEQPAPIVVAAAASTHVSRASTPREYRSDAASHLYSKNRERVYKGKLPPLLYAVGVLQVEVDGRGNVR